MIYVPVCTNSMLSGSDLPKAGYAVYKGVRYIVLITEESEL